LKPGHTCQAVNRSLPGGCARPLQLEVECWQCASKMPENIQPVYQPCQALPRPREREDPFSGLPCRQPKWLGYLGERSSDPISKDGDFPFLANTDILYLHRLHLIECQHLLRAIPAASSCPLLASTQYIDAPVLTRTLTRTLFSNH
jgi:hypothetical protein